MSKFYGRFKGTLEKNDNVLYYSHIIIPEEIVDHLKTNKIKRFVCTLGETSTFHAGMISNGTGGYFIIINKELRKKHRLEPGSAIEVLLSEDDSQYGMELPEEFAELFAQDPVGDRFFHELTPGKQRSLLFLVNKIKSTDKRLEKAIIILEHLTEQQGKLDYKILNQDFKDKKGRF